MAETDVPALAPSASLRAAAIGAAMDEADMETLSASSTPVSTPAFGFHMPALGSAGAGMVLLNLSAALFGTNQAVIRSIVDAAGDAGAALSPAALTAARFDVAALLFAPVALGAAAREVRAGRAATLAAAAELGAYLYAGYAMQAAGLAHTTASMGAFTSAATVLTVPILAATAGRDVPKATWPAAAAAAAGICLLATDGGGSAHDLSGDLMCVASALAFGLHKFRTGDISPSLKSASSSELVGMQLLVVAFLSSGGLSIEVHDQFLRAGGVPLWMVADACDAVESLWAPLAYISVVTTAFTLWIEVFALKSVSAPLAAIIYAAEPIWGAAVAAGFLGETLGTAGFGGAAMVMAGTAYAQMAPKEAGDGAGAVAALTESPMESPSAMVACTVAACVVDSEQPAEGDSKDGSEESRPAATVAAALEGVSA